MKKTSKLTFQKKEFRVLESSQLARIQGGDEDPNMILKGHLDTGSERPTQQ